MYTKVNIKNSFFSRFEEVARHIAPEPAPVRPSGPRHRRQEAPVLQQVYQAEPRQVLQAPEQAYHQVQAAQQFHHEEGQALLDYQMQDFQDRAWEDSESSDEEQEPAQLQYYAQYEEVQQQYEEMRPVPVQQPVFTPRQTPRQPKPPKALKAEAAPSAPGVFSFGKTQSADAYLSRSWDLWSATDIQTDKDKLR
jgi:hypothetical protein